MAIAQTQAATFIQEQTEEISSHKIISLLMDGALERIEQGIEAHGSGRVDDLLMLTSKLIAIINGLRNSLNMEDGGEISQNLDGLYEYMVEKITQSTTDNIVESLGEVRALLQKIKDGWDNMDLQNL